MLSFPRPIFCCAIATLPLALSALVLAQPALPDPPAGNQPPTVRQAAAPPAKRPKIPVTISKATTYITEPLRPDGYPDYLAAVDRRASRGVTPENNFVVLFRKAVGPGDVPPTVRRAYFKRLGISPLPADGHYFVDIYSFLDRELRKAGRVSPSDGEKVWEQFDRVVSGPWSKREFPLFCALANGERRALGVGAGGRQTSPLLFAAGRRERGRSAVGSDDGVGRFRPGAKMAPQHAIGRCPGDPGQGHVAAARRRPRRRVARHTDLPSACAVGRARADERGCGKRTFN